MGYFFLLLSLLVVAAGLVARWRVRSRTRSGDVRLSDEAIRQIEREGRLETDEREPLDRERIRKEEDRFWSETWDEPENLWG